jgi:hypothetical protein
MNKAEKLFAKYVEKPVSKAGKATGGILSNVYVNSFLTLFLIMYASLARPQLPNFLMDLFDNWAFRLVFMTGLAFLASRNIQAAILVAVAFTVTMNLLSEQKIVEGFLVREQMYSEVEE